MVRAGLELLGLRPAVEDEVNGPFLWPRLPRSPGPQELVLLQDYRIRSIAASEPPRKEFDAFGMFRRAPRPPGPRVWLRAL